MPIECSVPGCGCAEPLPMLGTVTRGQGGVTVHHALCKRCVLEPALLVRVGGAWEHAGVEGC